MYRTLSAVPPLGHPPRLKCAEQNYVEWMITITYFFRSTAFFISSSLKLGGPERATVFPAVESTSVPASVETKRVIVVIPFVGVLLGIKQSNRKRSHQSHPLHHPRESGCMEKWGDTLRITKHGFSKWVNRILYGVKWRDFQEKYVSNSKGRGTSFGSVWLQSLQRIGPAVMSIYIFAKQQIGRMNEKKWTMGVSWSSSDH